MTVLWNAEEAKSTGWAGDWDNRIERAKKKLDKTLIQDM